MRLGLIILLLCVQFARAATNNCADCARATVQTAINAMASGDTITCPAGSWTWTIQVDTLNKSINFIGAGTNANTETGSTIITIDNPSQGDNGFYWRGYDTNFLLLKGFTWKTANVRQYGTVGIEPRDHTVLTVAARVTQCRFLIGPDGVQSSRGCVFIGCYGLIDHCYFYNHSGNGQTAVASSTGDQYSTNNWHRGALAFGTTNALVIEDTVFDHSTVADGIDCYEGCNLTLRYCIITNSLIGGHGADSAFRGALLQEYYMNKFYTSGGYLVFTAFEMRGGTGVLWSNVMDSGFQDFCKLQVYRADPAYAAPNLPNGLPIGQKSDGNFSLTYPSSNYVTGYPLLDQIGRGPFPSVAFPDCTSGCNTNNYEALVPIYGWGNNLNGNTSPAFTPRDFSDTTNVQGYVKANREYFDNTVKPGYAALSYPHPLIVAMDGSGGGSGSTNGPGHAPARSQTYGGTSGRR